MQPIFTKQDHRKYQGLLQVARTIKLAIELDGIQHDLAEHREKDILSDNKLNSEGITVKRYSNIMISSNIRLVIKDLYNCIWEKLKQASIHKKTYS